MSNSNERKPLSSIAWEVTEPVYRSDPALSYSTLAKYEREGFNSLEHLFDKLETPSLTFGSAVDTLITGSEEEFQENFMVAEFPSIPDSIIKIVKSLFSTYGTNMTYKSLKEISDSIVIKETETQGYQLNWKPETRARVIKEKGNEYYKLLFLAGDRTILDTDTYEDICNTVEALKTRSATRFYFTPNDPFDIDVKRYYQLKFKEALNGIDYRCMADLLIVDHSKKYVIPCDLKTTSSPEWDFYKSFIKWRYEINKLFINLEIREILLTFTLIYKSMYYEKV